MADSGAAMELTRKRLALLAVLATAGDRGVSRGRLVSLVWPDVSAESGRHSLEQLLSILRQKFGDTLFLGSDPMRLNPAVIASDVTQFELALQRDDLAAAVELYKGPFLDTFHLSNAKDFEEWVDRERGRLTGRYAAALERLASDATKRGDHAAAAGWWRSLVLIDPLGARGVIGLMHALTLAGDRTAALRHARVHVALVREQLEMPADPAVTAFIQDILSGTVLDESDGAVTKHADDITAHVSKDPDPPTPRRKLSAPPEVNVPAPRRERGLPHQVRWLGGGALLVGLAAFGVWRSSHARVAELQLGRSIPVTSDPGLEIFPDLSPDGTLVAYSAGNFVRMRVFIRPVAGGRTVPLSDDSTAVEELPKWSPDGSRILFLSRGGVSVAPALGGSSRPIVASTDSPVSSASWSSDGTRIVVVRGDSVYTIAHDGTGLSLIATGRQLHSCTSSPNDTWVACVTMNAAAQRLGTNFGNLAPSGIVIFPFGGGPGRVMVDASASNYSPAWAPDRQQLLFLSNRDGPHDVYALDIGRSGEARGGTVRLTTGLGAMSFAIARDGKRIVYSAYRSQSNIWSLPIPSSGVRGSADATPLTSGNQVIEAMRASRDGRWIVYDSNLGGRAHIWRIAVDGGTPEQLTNGPTNEFAGDLSPDGRFLAYHSFRNGSRDIEVLPLAGGEAEVLTQTPSQESYPVWSADGSALLFYDQAPPATAFMIARLADGVWSTPRPLQTNVRGPLWSPDDRSLIWSTASDARVLIAPVDGGEPRELYRGGPGHPPARRVQLAPDGHIYFKSHDEVGRASFWVLNPDGTSPRLVAYLDDLSRPSSRLGFTVGSHRLYFQVEDRQSDVVVVEVSRR